ncbi:hypothetical protein H5410_003666 [Solanum commersonii]|uniref:Craniofacial development protein 2-like n=1 Tax=Solanum commersonii TaxID=4109 RepID=A0A9J6B5A2_SOLCO|nr:hypothetical protein H5410_003666 [Solanum commersonii]
MFGLGTFMLEVSSSKPLASESKGFAFWVELIAPGLPSADYLSYVRFTSPASEQPKPAKNGHRPIRQFALRRPETSRGPAPTGERRASLSGTLRSSVGVNNNQELWRANNSRCKVSSANCLSPRPTDRPENRTTRLYIRSSIFLVDLVPDGGIESCLRLRPRKRESRGAQDRNGVGILVGEDLREQVMEKIVIGGDFNGHIGATSNGFDDVHGGFGFGERNGGGTSLLDFAKAFELVIANSCFPKKENT